MEISTYDQIDDEQMSEILLACFDHPYSREHIRGMVEADCRLPSWGGELYAVEGDTVLGTCGLLYPRARFGDRIKTVGGIRNVCVRNSASGSGVATRLLEEAHRRLREQGVEHVFLMTSRGLVAHSLYRRLGYEDVLVYPTAFKAVEKVESDIEFKGCDDYDMVRELYMESVQGTEGLVIREKDYHEMAEARGWPDNDNLHFAYDDGEFLGYAMYKEGRKSLVCFEMAGVHGVEDIIVGMEKIAEGKHMVFKFVNPDHKDILERMGYCHSNDGWGVVMMRSFTETVLRGPIHNGIYESF